MHKQLYNILFIDLLMLHMCFTKVTCLLIYLHTYILTQSKKICPTAFTLIS